VTTPSDAELLRSFTHEQSEAAFAQLVARYVDLVYSSAFRQTSSHALAQDITQAIFVILARKASSLRRETVLSGWLFRAVRYAVLDAHKLEKRRQHREREAALMEQTSHATDDVWEQMAPVLDEALAALGARNRHAVLLRFFEKKSFAEIATVLGGNENSARVRVVRAIEKLRGHFRRRGVVLSAAAIAMALPGHATQAAPPLLAAAVAGGKIAAAGSGSITPLIQAVLRRLFWRKERVISAVAAILVLLILLWGGGTLRRQSERLRAEQLAAERAAVPQAVFQTMVAIDRSFFFNDPDRFVAAIHFRNPEDEQYRAVLADYIRAQASFRQEMKRVFNVQQRSFNVTFRELCIGQPPVGTGYVGVDRVATNIMMARYPLHLVKVRGEWKWDLFGGLSSDARDERMSTLARKSKLLESLAVRIREGTATNVTEILQLVQDAP
jgi:RNA polymerase sigma factor (sigma-70 family)